MPILATTLGYLNLGREILASRALPLYAMPRMKTFLQENAPWNLLIEHDHVRVDSITAESTIVLTEKFGLTPLLVPHRDEISETVGYRIDGPERCALYVPDIDDWRMWKRDLEVLLSSIDIAWMDGTFYSAAELPNRDLSLIGHPFVEETIKFFSYLSEQNRQKIHFIHLNHSNPLCDPTRPERKIVGRHGYAIAEENDHFIL